MEHHCHDSFSPSQPYDYRMYDRIWQRVSPELNPYPHIRAEQEDTTAPPDAPEPILLTPLQEADPPQLPGASADPCCMGTQAKESLGVLTGYLEEELAERQCCLALSRCVKNPKAAALFRTFAAEKEEAVQQLKAACYLITGTCFSPTVAVNPTRFSCLQEALRFCYHQEVCGGFNYSRSADETTDPCLQKLFSALSAQAYRRGESILLLLGKLLRK